VDVDVVAETDALVTGALAVVPSLVPFEVPPDEPPDEPPQPAAITQASIAAATDRIVRGITPGNLPASQ
jgi:hypothetical protein